ncbi:MAG: hypothetical protein A2Z31_04045 [candidate division NC10 bacterium RBG_16_65_8]|nr:MAG: hypothetical protein A2Z31_04045 [candidate division NC10 bacterium RBG_16_65_8]
MGDIHSFQESPRADTSTWLCQSRRDMTRRALTWILVWLGPFALRAWFSTIRLRWCGGAQLHPDPRTRRNGIYAFWHQRLLCFAYTHGRFRPRILVSQSRDGDIIARVASGLGCVPIRGSSRRGPTEAVRGLLAEAGSGYDFGITPDGPLGQRHAFKVGAVYLASQSGLPVVPIAVSYGRYWRFKSWDEFLVPWPFTWGVIHVGPPVAVPPDLDASGLETWRLRLQDILQVHTRTTDVHARELYLSGRTRRDL